MSVSQPGDFNSKSANDDTRYLVQNPQEILRVLRGLMQRNELVSAFFNNGNELLLTSVIEVNPEKHCIMLDYGSNQELNQRILKAERIIFVTSLDGVKVQFISTGVQKAVVQGRDAFITRIPAEVLHMQQREYYRLATPIVNPLKCAVPLPQGNTIELALADIGAGGLGVMLGAPPGAPLEPGAIYPGCRIKLGDIGTVEVTLRVQSVFEITLKNGSKSLRAGCQFVDLRPAMQSMLQRYIIKLERERIANSPH